jgi:uncharacterized membrane protein
MEKILVIVFDDEAKAYGGAHALEQMEKQGYLSFEKLTIVAKNRDGTTCALKTWGRHRLAQAITGSIVGGLVGLAGGVAGIAIGLTGGALIGSIGHSEREADQEFGNDIGDALTPGNTALIAEVIEESEEAVDIRMAAVGGAVFRFKHAQIAGVRNESSKLHARIDEFRGSLYDAMERRRVRTEARKQERERWIHLLDDQAAQARRKRQAAQAARSEELPAK